MKNITTLVSKLLITTIFASFIYGYANSSEAPADFGEGQNRISGFYIEVITYELFQQDPSKINSLTLDVTSNQNTLANMVKVSINNGESWVSCENMNSSLWRCTFINQKKPPIEKINTIRVVAKG